MIQWLSKLSRSWPAQIHMGALALSFIVWGIADVFTGGGSGTAVATVGSTEISAQDFSRDYRNLLRNQSQQSGIPDYRRDGPTHGSGKHVSAAAC